MVGLVAPVGSCVLMRFVAIDVPCEVCLAWIQRRVQSLTLDNVSKILTK